MTSIHDGFKEGKEGCRMGAEGLVLVCIIRKASSAQRQNEDDFAYVLYCSVSQQERRFRNLSISANENNRKGWGCR